MEVVVTNVRRWPGVVACDQILEPKQNGSDLVKEGSEPFSPMFQREREWMRIELTKPFFKGFAGFEAQHREFARHSRPESDMKIHHGCRHQAVSLFRGLVFGCDVLRRPR